MTKFGNTALFDLARSKIITVAHRGKFGGNIPCNTVAAYEIALRQGADMIEVDVDKTADGQLVIFHPGQEKSHLCYDGCIRELTLEQIRANIRYVNFDDTPTPYTLATLEEVLETFKGRCFINIDKFWDNPIEISQMIRRHGMQGQIVVKSAPTQRMLEIVEAYAGDIPYLSVVRDGQMLDQLLNRNICYVGAETLFAADDAQVCAEAFIQKLHGAGKLLWVNSIVYDSNKVISGGHNDDAAICGDPEHGWGWLADRGYDIIQTDWPLEMTLFLEKTGRLHRG